MGGSLGVQASVSLVRENKTNVPVLPASALECILKSVEEGLEAGLAEARKQNPDITQDDTACRAALLVQALGVVLIQPEDILARNTNTSSGEFLQLCLVGRGKPANESKGNNRRVSGNTVLPGVGPAYTKRPSRDTVPEQPAKRSSRSLSPNMGSSGKIQRTSLKAGVNVVMTGSAIKRPSMEVTERQGSTKTIRTEKDKLNRLSMSSSDQNFIKAANVIGDAKLAEKAKDINYKDVSKTPKALQLTGSAMVASAKAQQMVGTEELSPEIKQEQREADEREAQANLERALSQEVLDIEKDKANSSIPGVASMKAAYLVGDKEMEQRALEQVSDNVKVNVHALDKLGEAGKLAPVHARKLLGDEMTAKAKAEQLQAEQDAIRKAAEDDERARNESVAKVMHQGVKESMFKTDHVTSKAAQMMGDAELEKQAREVVPVNAHVSNKVLNMMGSAAVVSTKAAAMMGDEEDLTCDSRSSRRMNPDSRVGSGHGHPSHGSPGAMHLSMPALPSALVHAKEGAAAIGSSIAHAMPSSPHAKASMRRVLD